MTLNNIVFQVFQKWRSMTFLKILFLVTISMCFFHYRSVMLY